MMANKLQQFLLPTIAPALFFSHSVVAQNYNVYLGDLHQHSIYSFDAQPGALEPAAAFAYAKNVAKIDFMAISDHTTQLSESNYQRVRTATRLYDDSQSQFVAIAGQELGSLGSSGYGHMNIFESLARADNASDSDTRFDLQHAYQFLIDNALLGQFNHPTTENANSNFRNLEFYQPVDPFLNALEVLNGKRSANYERFYLQALANGWHLGAVGDQDNHGGFYGNQISNSGDIYLTGILADSLTKPNILEAIKNRRTYAFQTSPTTDRIYLTEFTGDGRCMGEIFGNDDNLVAFNVAANAEGKFISVQLYQNGFLLKNYEPNANSFTWTITDSTSFGAVYYFLKLVQEDTDVLWSSPIWVNSSGEYQPPEKQITPIGEIRENFSNGVPRRLGRTNITVRGIGTIGRQFGTNGPGYLQDSTAGVAVFGSLFTEKVIPGAPLEFEVTGVVSFFNGQTEIIPYSVTRLGVKSFPTTPRISTGEIASNGEAYEGSLVLIAGATITGNFPPPGADANLIIDDGSGPSILRIDKDTNIPGTPTPNGKVNITGVVGQFDVDLPYISGYQILPRSTNDIEIISGVEKLESTDIPKSFVLSQNYPNPFNAETKIIYAVPYHSHVSLKIYTITGQKVRTLLDGESFPGEYRAFWNGKDEAGKKVSSGIYFYRLEAVEFSAVKKMILLQ